MFIPWIGWGIAFVLSITLLVVLTKKIKQGHVPQSDRSIVIFLVTWIGSLVAAVVTAVITVMYFPWKGEFFFISSIISTLFMVWLLVKDIRESIQRLLSTSNIPGGKLKR